MARLEVPSFQLGSGSVAARGPFGVADPHANPPSNNPGTTHLPIRFGLLDSLTSPPVNQRTCLETDRTEFTVSTHASGRKRGQSGRTSCITCQPPFYGLRTGGASWLLGRDLDLYWPGSSGANAESESGEVLRLRDRDGRCLAPWGFHLVLLEVLLQEIVEEGANHSDRAELADIGPAGGDNAADDVGGEFEL